MGMSGVSRGEGEVIAGDLAPCFVFLLLFGVRGGRIPWIKGGVAEMVNRIPSWRRRQLGADPDASLYVCREFACPIQRIIWLMTIQL